MKKLSLSILLLLILIVFTGCKKCDPTNSASGIVIENAIVRVISGTQPGNKFITHASQYNKTIEMSLDGGETYELVDFNKYSVLSLTTTASCSSGYHRDVSLTSGQKVVTYTVEITECKTCEGTVTIPNWVLTERVPGDYTAKFVSKSK